MGAGKGGGVFMCISALGRGADYALCYAILSACVYSDVLSLCSMFLGIRRVPTLPPCHAMRKVRRVRMHVRCHRYIALDQSHAEEPPREPKEKNTPSKAQRPTLCLDGHPLRLRLIVIVDSVAVPVLKRPFPAALVFTGFFADGAVPRTRVAIRGRAPHRGLPGP